MNNSDVDPLFRFDFEEDRGSFVTDPLDDLVDQDEENKIRSVIEGGGIFNGGNVSRPAPFFPGVGIFTNAFFADPNPMATIGNSATVLMSGTLSPSYTAENYSMYNSTAEMVTNPMKNLDNSTTAKACPGTLETLAPIVFTIINLVCFLIFCPVNLKIVKLYLGIMCRGQPFFGLFVAVQGLCILDLVVCLTEVVSLWVEMPIWACRAQIGISQTIHLGLSLIICAICIYR